MIWKVQSQDQVTTSGYKGNESALFEQPFNLRILVGIQTRQTTDRADNMGEYHSEMDYRIASLPVVIHHLSLFNAYRETIALSNCMG